jgi:hypothetical protein
MTLASLLAAFTVQIVLLQCSPRHAFTSDDQRMHASHGNREFNMWQSAYVTLRYVRKNFNENGRDLRFSRRRV